MANTLYDAARQAFLEAEIHWLNNTIKVYLVAGSNYTVNVASHATVDEIGSSGRVAGPVEIGSKSTTGGAADGADVTFTSVDAIKPTVTAIVIYKDSGQENTSTLIAYIDTATGLPISPNGGDIIVTWDNGVNKIFRV